MLPGTILLAGVSLALVQSSGTAQPPAPCAQVSADVAIDAAASEICAGDDAARRAGAEPGESAARARLLETAAGHYRRAATVASTSKVKLLALNVLAGVYGADHLKQPREMESVLREIVALTPEDLAPVFRLAALQEDEGLLDAAEATLLDARRRQPDNIEPYKMLTQFFARRVTALHAKDVQSERQADPPSTPGEADEHGIYRLSESMTRPAREGVPVYPQEAQHAGVRGAVTAEVVVDPSGTVVEARIVRSVPMLDDAALQTVSKWRFAPTIVNGQAVPVRFNVTVNFTLPATPPPPAPPR